MGSCAGLVSEAIVGDRRVLGHLEDDSCKIDAREDLLEPSGHGGSRRDVHCHVELGLQPSEGSQRSRGGGHLERYQQADLRRLLEPRVGRPPWRSDEPGERFDPSGGPGV